MAGGVIHDGGGATGNEGGGVAAALPDAPERESHPAPSAETVATWGRLACASLVGLRAEFGVSEGVVETGLQSALRETLAEIDTLNGVVDGFARLSEAQNAEIGRLSGLAKPLPGGRFGPGVLSVGSELDTPRCHRVYECGGCGEPVGGAAGPFRLDWPMGRPGPPWRFCPACGAALGDYPAADGRYDSVRGE